MALAFRLVGATITSALNVAAEVGDASVTRRRVRKQELLIRPHLTARTRFNPSSQRINYQRHHKGRITKDLRVPRLSLSAAPRTIGATRGLGGDGAITQDANVATCKLAFT